MYYNTIVRPSPPNVANKMLSVTISAQNGEAVSAAQVREQSKLVEFTPHNFRYFNILLIEYYNLVKRIE